MSKRAAWAASARRHLPASTARGRAKFATALALRNDKVVQRAEQGMRLLLEAARPDADFEALARRHVAYTMWSNEARWHPRLNRPLRVDGLEHLREDGRGTIVSFLHHGPFVVIGPSLAPSGREVHVIADPSLCPPQAKPWQAQVHAMATQGKASLFSAAEGSRGIKERLARGAVVAVASDVPGHSVVTFLGRQLVGSSGAARVAFDTGSPVLPCTMRRDESGAPYYRLDAPLEPGTFESPEALLAEMLRRQEHAVLAWPEAYHEPLGKWSLADALEVSGASR